MPKIREIKSNGWKPVDLEGPILASSFDGLIGIEELTDYTVTKGKKKSKIIQSTASKRKVI